MTSDNSRRAFLKRAGALSMAGAAGPLALNLAAFGQAAAATANDYKALVCVFLYGGNDYANTLVPCDSLNHQRYFDQRPAIATPLADLAGTVLNPLEPLPEGRQYALAPQLLPLLQPFQDGKLAVMLNIGTLIEPTSKQQYSEGTVKLPPKLFSHNDQQSFYQSSGPEGNTTGWGGRMGDLFDQNNGNATFTCISVGSSGVFASGASTVAYQVSPAGAVPINAIKQPLFGSVACQQAMRALVTAPSTQLFEAEHTRIVQRSIDAEALLTPALEQAPPSSLFPAGNPLAAQLSMVARIISKQAQLLAGGQAGPKRQVFFVTLGGFDLHSGLKDDHPVLLDTVGQAMAAFHAETQQQGVDRQVTLFTASDFGRTLNADGDGSDHGWGSMHFVLGGAVNGGRFYGEAPVPADNGPNDVGRGRLLPRIAVDQFAAKLATWFGVLPGDIGTVLPNLKNFALDRLPLDFMQSPTA
ncbi:hypothetical protein BurJ1DRAFT_3402 [Burkholderiales bacterium JOSHI_001]|nr:hypothetical protein BurJ1DRAFT_3402 [Burkholderiales bacterium JOSHI_001]